MVAPENTVEEVEFFRSCGVDARDIARSLGVKPGTVAQRLRRAGRRDLARPFDALAQADRPGHPCEECGAEVRGKTGRWCVDCAPAMGALLRWSAA